jgi:hypothetical protein
VFKVGTPDGKIVEREVRALDSGTAREELAREGLHIFNEQTKGFSLDSILPRYRPMATEKFLMFNHYDRDDLQVHSIDEIVASQPSALRPVESTNTYPPFFTFSPRRLPAAAGDREIP